MLGLSEQGKKAIAYGLWRYAEDDLDLAIEMLSLAREAGIDHLDTADVYGGKGGFGGAERLLGAVRSRAPELLEGAVLATKAGVEPGAPYNSSATYLKAACEGSLLRLGVERVDLFYVHRPDLLTHPAELAQTLDGLISSGKVGAVGVSNFTTSQVDALCTFLKAPLVAHQIEFSAAHLEPIFDGTLDQAMARGMAAVAWSPLARGHLCEEGPSECARVRDVLRRLGEKYGASPAAMAIAFLLEHPAPVTPILGTRTPDRLRDCMKASALSLSRNDWYAVVEACRGSRMP